MRIRDTVSWEVLLYFSRMTLFISFRVGKQRLREARILGVDYLILCLAGICLGTLAKVSDETFGALGYTYTVIAVCKSGLPSLLSKLCSYVSTS
jgi:hypothetical protein